MAGFADATGRYLPSSAPSTPPRSPTPSPGSSASTTREFDALALSAPAGAGGLVLVPHFDGERTPNRPEATGTLAGIGHDVTPANLARAAVEGVVCNLLGGVDSLAMGDRADSQRVFLVGGGARSSAYRQITVDLVGSPVIVPSESELVASGAAVQAAAVYHRCGFDAVAEAWGLGVGDVVEPRGSVDRTAVRAAFSEVMEKAARSRGQLRRHTRPPPPRSSRSRWVGRRSYPGGVGGGTTLVPAHRRRQQEVDEPVPVVGPGSLSSTPPAWVASQ